MIEHKHAEEPEFEPRLEDLFGKLEQHAPSGRWRSVQNRAAPSDEVSSPDEVNWVRSLLLAAGVVLIVSLGFGLLNPARDGDDVEATAAGPVPTGDTVTTGDTGTAGPTGTSPAASVVTVTTEDGRTLSDVRLRDHTRLALFLPERWGTDVSLNHQFGDEADHIALAAAGEMKSNIYFEDCASELDTQIEDVATTATGMIMTEGDLSAGEGSWIRLCRPGEHLAIGFSSRTDITQADLDSIWIAPITISGSYAKYVTEAGIGGGQCCFEDRGPAWIDSDTFVLAAGPSGGHRVIAFDADPLLPVWSVDVAQELPVGASDPGEGVTLVWVADETDSVLVNVGQRYLAALDAGTGTYLWHHGAGPAIAHVSRVGEGAVALATHAEASVSESSANLTVLNLQDGSAIWSLRGQPPEVQRWSRASPVVIGDSLVLGTMTGDVIAYDRATGTRLWSTSLPSAFPATDIVIDPSRPDPLLLAVHELPGQGSDVQGSDVQRIDPETGETRWIAGIPPGAFLSGLSPEAFYIQLADGDEVAYSLLTGDRNGSS